MLVCLFAGLFSAWAQKKEQGSPRAKYHAALKKLQTGSKGEVEPVFRLGLIAAQQLQEEISQHDVAVAAGKKVVPLDTKLEGFSVSTEEVLYAVPKPGFFLELARKKGTPVDVAFFENLQRTFAQHDAWPVVIQQQTDYSGCTLYQAPELLAIYKGWTEFAAKHPKAYASEVAKELLRIEQAMTQDGCACGKSAEVIAGFEAFLRTFPRVSIASQVKSRLEALKAGKGDMRFECQSG
ncbi:hypothetical protein [Hyalangium sp.]|uniref:hypothetical protein n=1 Tax=Hyalangium sp. TaxID=2028555 RepID=UPI002D6BEB4A|nr:hypothetical protein [Hyalangium sp.]HYI02302.1 hypothetical protein [Hyalangium sp.]